MSNGAVSVFLNGITKETKKCAKNSTNDGSVKPDQLQKGFMGMVTSLKRQTICLLTVITMLKLKSKTVIFAALLASATLFTGCAALDAPIHQAYNPGNSCDLQTASASEPYHMRFEVVTDEQSHLPGQIRLENTKLLATGSETLVFSGEDAPIVQGTSNSSQIWVLASLGQNKEGNLCLKTRTATRALDANGNSADSKTRLDEVVQDIEMGRACGESILVTTLPGLDNAMLRISSAPNSTAKYLHNPEKAMDSSCAQLVDSLSPEQSHQYTSELRIALGV